MKTLLTFALALLSLSVASLGQTPQGNALRATNGSGYNSTFYGPVSVANYIYATNTGNTNTLAGLIQQGGIATSPFSSAFGVFTRASGGGAFVTGRGSESFAQSSLVGGESNTIGSSAIGSLVAGKLNQVADPYNFAVGFNNFVAGEHGAAIGRGAVFDSSAHNSIALGNGVNFQLGSSNSVGISASTNGLTVALANSFQVNAPGGNIFHSGVIYGDGSGITNIGSSGGFSPLVSGNILLLGANGTNRYFQSSADTDAARGVNFTNALALAAAVDTLVLGPGTYNVQASRFITNTLVFQNGAMLKPASGVTLTNDGRQVAEPSQQIYDLSAGGAISLVRNFTMDTVYFDWFGAKGNNGQNGVTAPDCSGAITSAWAAAIQPPATVTDGGLPADLNASVIAHTPFVRKLKFGVSHGVYIMTNSVNLTNAWWPYIDGNGAMLVGNNPWGRTNGMVTFGDVYKLQLYNLIFKAVESRQQKWAVVIENSLGNTLPSIATIKNCSFFGNRKGFKHSLWFRPGTIDANNEGHIVQDCVFLDHERCGILVSMSQTYAVQVINCAFNGAPGQQYDGWHHVSGFDPEDSPESFGGFQIRGGHGGGAQGSCFLFPASGRPSDVIGFDNEDTSRFVWQGAWYPVTNLNFTFKPEGDSLEGTNLVLAAFAKDSTNVITFSATNTYTANRRTFEYVDKDTNVTRIAVTYAENQPWQPSTGNGTLYAVVETDADGITNVIRTGGSGEGLTQAPSPLNVQGCSINYTYCWDGRVIGVYNGPVNIFGNRIRQFGTQKVKAMVSVSGMGYGIGSVSIFGNGYLDLTPSGPTNMVDRIYFAASDGSRMTNGIDLSGLPIEPTKIYAKFNTLYDNTGATNIVLNDYETTRSDIVNRGTYSLSSGGGNLVPMAITNTGTGDSFRVEDEASDSTPTTITAAGTFRPGGGITLPVGGGDGLSLGGASYNNDYNSIDSSGAIMLRYANGDDLRIFNQTTTKAILGDAGWMIIPPIISTNTATANTALTLNGAASGGTGKVIEFLTNNVSKFSVNTVGEIVSPSILWFTNPAAASSISNAYAIRVLDGVVIRDATADRVTLSYATGTGIATLSTIGSVGWNVVANHSSGPNIAFGTGTGGAVTTKMTIANAGNVGIGLTGPTNKLQVIGDIHADTTIFANDFYATNDVSALTFTDRSDSPDTLEDAFRIVESIEPLNGKVDHSKMDPMLAAKTSTGIDQSRRNLSMLASAQAMVIKDLIRRIELLEAKQ